MGGAAKGVQDGGTVLVGEIQFARSPGSKIMGYHPIDLQPEGLSITGSPFMAIWWFALGQRDF